VETKKRQAKTEELSLSRFQKSSCLLKQPKNSKKILKKKAINPEIKKSITSDYFLAESSGSKNGKRKRT